MAGERPGQWAELIAPIVMHFDVAAKFGLEATWNAEGARACAVIWKRMAKIIDDEIAARVPADLEDARAALAQHDTPAPETRADDAGGGTL